MSRIEEASRILRSIERGEPQPTASHKITIQINRCKQPMEKPLSITEFAEKNGLTIVVNEREQIRPGEVGRFYADFADTDIKDGSVLIGMFGDGASPDEAIDNYARLINGKLLVVRAYGADRRELWAHLAL